MKISIPTPCHEKWEEMTPNERGRFCASCQKTVVDFTGWTDNQLVEFFLNNQNNICGRFTAFQLNHNLITANQRKSQFYKLAALLGFSSFFIFDQKTRAQTENVFVENISNKNGIKGCITNKKNEPLQWACVHLVSEDNKFDTTILSDSDGAYNFSNLQPGKYSLSAHEVGYTPLTVSPVYVCNNGFTEQDFIVDEAYTGLTVVTVYYPRHFWLKHPWKFIKIKILKIRPL